MDFELKFNMDNAAFEQYPEGETERILIEIGRMVIEGSCYGNISDINGNKIGTWSFSD